MVTIWHERFCPVGLFPEVLCFHMYNFIYKNIWIACRLLHRCFSQETIASRILWNLSVLSSWKCFLFLLCFLFTLNPPILCLCCNDSWWKVFFHCFLLAVEPSALILDLFQGCSRLEEGAWDPLQCRIIREVFYIRSYIPPVYQHLT